MTFACVITTPLGVPVEPEVNRMCAGSFRVRRRGGAAALDRVRSAAANRARGAAFCPRTVVEPAHRHGGGARTRAGQELPTRRATGPAARIHEGEQDAMTFPRRAAGLDGSRGT